MAGITSIGAYVPRYRLSLAEIGKFWRTRTAAGEKAVAGYDEDSVTMAVAAARYCLERNALAVDGLYFATTTAPYREKQGAAIIAGAADLDGGCRTADFTDSLRAGSAALRSAADAVQSGSARNILVLAADCRTGAPQGRFEQILGDGAAAVAVGRERTLADIEECHSVYSDFPDFWRKDTDIFVQSSESRFAYTAGYLPVMQEAVSGLMKKCGAEPGGFSKIVYTAADAKEHAGLGKKLGFRTDQIQDPLLLKVGHTGTAAPFVMLAAALEEARPGDRILLACYGDGCDAIALRVTDAVTGFRSGSSLKEKLAQSVAIDYGRYLH